MSLVPVSLTILSLLGDPSIAGDCFGLVILHVLPYLYFWAARVQYFDFQVVFRLFGPKEDELSFSICASIVTAAVNHLFQPQLGDGYPLYRPSTEKRKKKAIIVEKKLWVNTHHLYPIGQITPLST